MVATAAVATAAVAVVVMVENAALELVAGKIAAMGEEHLHLAAATKMVVLVGVAAEPTTTVVTAVPRADASLSMFKARHLEAA